jgi:hypothetical protein
MAHLVFTLDRGGQRLYVRRIGRKGVTWTPDRDKARRFRTPDAAETAQSRARAAIRADGVRVNVETADDETPDNVTDIADRARFDPLA